MSSSRPRSEDPARRRVDGPTSPGPGAATPEPPDRTQAMVDALRRLDDLFAATVETLDAAIAELAAPDTPAAGAPRAGATERPTTDRRPGRDDAAATGPRASEPGLDAAALPSPAEQRVLELLPTTLTRREIADELHLSMNTIKSHTRMLYLRLGVTTRTAAVDAARERGLLQRRGSAT